MVIRGEMTQKVTDIDILFVDSLLEDEEKK
jgi:hypothetical protein